MRQSNHKVPSHRDQEEEEAEDGREWHRVLTRYAISVGVSTRQTGDPGHNGSPNPKLNNHLGPPSTPAQLNGQMMGETIVALQKISSVLHSSFATLNEGLWLDNEITN